MNLIRFLVFWGALIVPGFPAFAEDPAPPFPPIPPRSPEDAATAFQVGQGFTMRLLAAEPMVTDPVSVTYDEAGRAYVAEMNDYPYTDPAQHHPNQENPTDAPIGRIRRLVDTDGDGIFDQSTVFAEGLSWPTGMACWKGGIFVIATPDWLYLKDTDGDGRADQRERVWTGFRKYNVQSVANNPVWGLDHRIYLAAGSNGASLLRPGTQGPPLKVIRADVSFDPRTGDARLESGGARFGHSFDDAGNRFVCNIRNPAQQVLFSPRDLGSVAFLPSLPPLHDAALSGDSLPVHRISPPETWRVVRAERWARTLEGRYPHSELVGSGVVTSSSGVTLYRGDAYPESFRGQVFVADVAANLFYRLGLRRQGCTFTAHRLDEGVEFCASRDIWHRPVNFTNDPQGCLTVSDMYRETIEHPWSIPDDLHARLDLRRGMDRGRLWRLEPPAFQSRKINDLGSCATEELVALLPHPNAWHRETAHRLLFERQDVAAVSSLRQLLEHSPSALGRLHALWSLHGLGALTGPDLITAMDKRFPMVQEAALRLAVEFPEATVLQGLILDTDPLNHPAPVVFQALLTTKVLGLSNHPTAPAFFASVAAVDQPWLNEALLYASGGRLDLPWPIKPADPSDSPLLRLRAFALARIPDPGEAGRLCHAINGALVTAEDAAGPAPAAALTALAALSEGLGPDQDVFAFSESRGVRDLKQHALPGISSLVSDPSVALDSKARLLPLLRFAPVSEAVQSLSGVVSQSKETEMAIAALQALAMLPGQEPALAVEGLWPSLTPTLRNAALEVWFSREERMPALLRAVGQGLVSPVHLSATRREALLTHPDPTIAEAAKTLFSGARPRDSVIKQYSTSLETRTLPGDAAAGLILFRQWCSACHRRQDEGTATIGPNLATVQAWTEEQILVNILDPSREVASEFVEHLAELKDGKTVSGTLLSESDSGLLIRQSDGTKVGLLRSQLKRLVTRGVSLMPEGFESALPPGQMADLIAFLKSPLP